MLPIFKSFQPHPQIACSPEEFDPAIHKATYRFNYPAVFAHIAKNPEQAKGIFRSIVMKDRFFIAYFVAGWESGAATGNKPFIVNMCRMAEDGPRTRTVDVWGREHGKSTILTVAGTLQRIVNDPECCTAIFSYKKGAADKFLDSIRKLLESEFMVWCFPDICYAKPHTESPFWGLQTGIRVKRSNQIRKENTVEAFGLVEGMPTGGHWDHLVYDDVETDDMAQSPDQMELCFNKLMMSGNLGREGGTEQVIGTYYSHCGVLVKLGEMKQITGEPMYKIRIFPGTDDGTINGTPVFFSQEYLDLKKTKPGFNTQILCNPTPSNEIRLNFDRFVKIKKDDLPKNRAKVIIIDPAGDKDVQSGKKNDSWAMLCLSVELERDEQGNQNVYLEDAIVGEFGLSASTDAACNLYMRNGRISILGIEKVGQSTQYDQIMQGLKARGVYIAIKKKGQQYGNLMLMAPAGRDKNYRIESGLAWPLNNGKLHIVDTVDPDVAAALKGECDKFPFFHVDILDAMAYLYDILADESVVLIPCYIAKTEMRPENKSTPRSPMCA
jgi:hypothetical protein